MADDKVLVIGGTGDTGKLVIMRLLARARHVRVYARNPAKAREMFGTSVEVQGGEVDDEDATLVNECRQVESRLGLTEDATGDVGGAEAVHLGAHRCDHVHQQPWVELPST